MDNNKVNFVLSIVEAAKKVASETGLSYELTLAQAVQETAWGTSLVLKGTNNLFSIKADPSWNGPKKLFHNVPEVINGSVQYVDAEFRVYANYEEAIRDRVKFLSSNPRYTALFEEGTLGSFEAEARVLQSAGYATDPSYADKLVSVFQGKTMQHALRVAFSDSSVDSEGGFWGGDPFGPARQDVYGQVQPTPSDTEVARTIAPEGGSGATPIPYPRTPEERLAAGEPPTGDPMNQWLPIVEGRPELGQHIWVRSPAGELLDVRQAGDEVTEVTYVPGEGLPISIRTHDLATGKTETFFDARTPCFSDPDYDATAADASAAAKGESLAAIAAHEGLTLKALLDANPKNQRRECRVGEERTKAHAPSEYIVNRHPRRTA
jgi:hypothetical protein